MAIGSRALFRTDQSTLPPSGTAEINSEYILAIDNGTQSVRALFFDCRGNLAAKAQVKLDYRQPRPGWMENDPENLWCSLSVTVINLDRNGKPLRPAIIWAGWRSPDQRTK